VLRGAVLMGAKVRQQPQRTVAIRTLQHPHLLAPRSTP
jgi:hypothetical protein